MTNISLLHVSAPGCHPQKNLSDRKNTSVALFGIIKL